MKEFGEMQTGITIIKNRVVIINNPLWLVVVPPDEPVLRLQLVIYLSVLHNAYKIQKVSFFPPKIVTLRFTAAKLLLPP